MILGVFFELKPVTLKNKESDGSITMSFLSTVNELSSGKPDIISIIKLILAGSSSP